MTFVGEYDKLKLLGKSSCRAEKNWERPDRIMEFWEWTGFIWLRTGTNFWAFWRRRWTIGCHKIRRICCVPENLLDSQRLGLISQFRCLRPLLLKRLYFFLRGGGFPHLIVVKFSEVSEEPTAYNLRVTQLFQVDAEEKRRIDMRRLYRMV